MEVDWNGHLQTNLTLTNLKQPKYAIKTHEEYKRSKEGVKHKKVVKTHNPDILVVHSFPYYSEAKTNPDHSSISSLCGQNVSDG